MQHKLSVAVGVSMLAVAGIVVTQYASPGGNLNLQGELGASSAMNVRNQTDTQGETTSSSGIKFCQDENEEDAPGDIRDPICGGLCPSGQTCGISAGECKCRAESSSFSSSWCTKPNEEKCSTSCCNKDNNQSCGTDAQGNPACVFCAGPTDDLCSPGQSACCTTTTEKCVWDNNNIASCVPKSKSSSFSSSIKSCTESPSCGGPCPVAGQTCIRDTLSGGCTCVMRAASSSFGSKRTR